MLESYITCSIVKHRYRGFGLGVNILCHTDSLYYTAFLVSTVFFSIFTVFYISDVKFRNVCILYLRQYIIIDLPVSSCRVMQAIHCLEFRFLQIGIGINVTIWE